AWIAVIIVLPILGIISFFFFGRNPVKRKFSHHQYKEMDKIKQTMRDLPSPVLSEAPELSQQIAHLTKSMPLHGNDITILTNAKNHIHMQYYIFREDEIGTEIRDILIQKAQAGVEVRFLYDGWGTKLSSQFIKPLIDMGVDVEIYDPIYSFWIARTANLRNHRKII